MSKTIVVTGAGDGLGRALARRFAADGDTVILLGRTLAKVRAVADELGPPHLALHCDVGRPDSVRAAFADIATRHARIDVLVNNAAVYEPFVLADATDARIAAQLATNLAGPIFCAREALPLLRGGGQIVNVTSESVMNKFPMLWMYASSKAALEMISDLWGDELAGDGVRVTVVQAGPMYDEAKAGTGWAPDVTLRFVEAAARMGINMRERPISHYRSVTDAFRAVIDTPPDLHVAKVVLRGWRG